MVKAPTVPSSAEDRTVPKLLAGPLQYRRLGVDKNGKPMCPGDWLQTYTDATTGYFIYPDEDGFQLAYQPVQMDPNAGVPVDSDSEEVPISGVQQLEKGMLLDRFGNENGKYLAPYGTPFAQRALPPASLNPPLGASSDGARYNYHVYRVLRPFEALSGPIAAWFGQPGQGTQYYVEKKTVEMLLKEGYLERAVDFATVISYRQA
ncbi:hypothetical protein C8F01DRAFT_1322488 [Mycena amicta]|nr:hypothetical protein C8F01DRAFT_1322488 [Mycena amicta]